jgi:uncharacterized protein
LVTETLTKNKSRRWRAGLFLVFLVCGLAVFLLSIAFEKAIPVPTQTVLRIVLAVIFLAAALILSRLGRTQSGQVLYVFFIATFAMLLSWEVSGRWLHWLAVSVNTPQGCAFACFTERCLWIVPIILLVKLGRRDLASLYIKSGNLRRGLTVGLIGFGFFLFTSFFAAKYLFKAQDLTAAKALAWAPWILIFVVCNAAGEELLYRGLFLQRFAALLGPRSANVCVALIFTLAHVQVKYSPDVLLFLAILFPLALWWGYLMQKTDGLWGSILFHAGADIPVMLGIFSRFS